MKHIFTMQVEVSFSEGCCEHTCSKLIRLRGGGWACGWAHVMLEPNANNPLHIDRCDKCFEDFGTPNAAKE
jgi:hypothetical protein